VNEEVGDIWDSAVQGGHQRMTQYDQVTNNERHWDRKTEGR